MSTPALLLLALAAAQPAAGAPSSADVFELPDDQFVAQARRDLSTLKLYVDGMRRLRDSLEPHRALFQVAKEVPHTPENKELLLGGWAALYDYVLWSEVLRQRYWDYWRLPPARKAQRAWGYLISHGALTAQLAYGLWFVDLAGSRKPLEVLFDEPSPQFGVPPRAFADFKLKVVHVSTSTQLMTGDAYGHQLLPAFKETRVLDDELARPWLLEIRRNAKTARDQLKRRGIKLFAKAAADIVSDSASAAFFPVQKGVAEWMGDTRVHRKGKPLISRAQVDEVVARMEPGDIILSRQNWYLSNVGLPGFWPHGELYLGTPEQLAAYFDGDPEVQAWLAAQPGAAKKLSEHLAQRFPEKWKVYNGKDEHGDPLRIMEAISEGVSFTGVEHGLHNDYIGVLRPRLSKLEKAQAFVRAFGYQGLPYDFDFDFLSDSALVCTELVFKSYAPSKTMKGLRLKLVNIAGRTTLPPNEFVQLFDREYGKEDRQLDFVAFLDGREETKNAVVSDAEAFRGTYKRVKWDIAQE